MTCETSTVIVFMKNSLTRSVSREENTEHSEALREWIKPPFTTLEIVLYPLETRGRDRSLRLARFTIIKIDLMKPVGLQKHKIGAEPFQNGVKYFQILLAIQCSGKVLAPCSWGRRFECPGKI